MQQKRTFLGALAAVAIAGIATTAYAYSEKTDVARLTVPRNSGCFEQSTALIHGGANDPIEVVFKARMTGRTRLQSNKCNTDWPAGSGSWLVAQPAAYVIKLNNTNDPSQGYFVCAQPDLAQQILVPQVDVDVVYPTPPCGPGYYALVACFNSLTSYTSTPSGTVIGNYAASFFFPARDCNVSPFWHPAGVPNVVQGPAVVL